MKDLAPCVRDRLTTRRRWRMRLLMVAVSLTACEFILQAGVRMIPAVDWALMAPQERLHASRIGIMVSDAVLGLRGNPDYPAHDRLGFNNASVPERADLITLGDSQTYGVVGSPDLNHRVEISSDVCWPAYLADLSGRSVYNMGLGGWGPVEYLHVLDEALAMNPQSVVLGLYLGNDLADAFSAVYLRGQYTDLANPDFAEAVAAAEAERPYFDPVTGAFPSRPDSPPNSVNTRNTFLHGCRTLLAENCKLYGFARAVKDLGLSQLGLDAASIAAAEDDWVRAERWSATRSKRYFPFDGGRFRTILSPPYRCSAVNLDDPRIGAGLHITLSAIRRCSARCGDVGVDFTVALIPTKELVFEAIVPDLDRFPKYRELQVREHALRELIATDLAEHGIPCIDTLDALHGCFDHGEQPYAVSGDGHPNAVGYRAIATAVATHLKRQVLARGP